MKLWVLFSTLLFTTPLLAIVSQLTKGIVTFIGSVINYFFQFDLKKPTDQPKGFKKKWITFVDGFNRSFGIWEYTIRGCRDVFFLFFIPIYLILKHLLTPHLPLSLGANDLVLVGLLCLVFTTRKQQIFISLQLAEMARVNPHIHPKDFFETYYRLLGPLSYRIPPVEQQRQVDAQNVSFKDHERAQLVPWLLVSALWDTTHLAHIALKSLKYVGKDYARDVFDVMASMWGKRILQVTKSSFQITGIDKIKDLPGKVILVFNHKSQLDFVLTFFALCHFQRPSSRGFRPRFITAKDHFVDNRLVYDVMGVGKLIETVDMVFIERKKKGRAIENLKQAAYFLAHKDIDIAIFPQGTRTVGNIDRSLKRRDAGYYTTVSPRDMSEDLGHLRKGTAYLAADTLMELAKKGENELLHLVFIGLSGTATILPKESLKLQTETDVVYEVGEPLTLNASMVANCKKPRSSEARDDAEMNYMGLVNQLNYEIDTRLANSLHIHEHLKHRFLVDLQGHFRYSQDRMEIIDRNLDRMEKESSIVYQILDRIYALPPQEWNAYLSELSHLVLEGRSTSRLPAIREQITVKMLNATNVKLHGKRIQKKSLGQAA